MTAPFLTCLLLHPQLHCCLYPKGGYISSPLHLTYPPPLTAGGVSVQKNPSTYLCISGIVFLIESLVLTVPEVPRIHNCKNIL